MDLSDLKKSYAEIAKSYSLPGFDELAVYFEIDRIETESLFLLRDVRKVIIDKFLEFTKLVEMIMNPANAPPLFLQFIKQITAQDKTLLERIYENFVLIELESMACDIRYVASREATVIKKAFLSWKQHEKDLDGVVALMNRNFNSSSAKREKSYLG